MKIIVQRVKEASVEVEGNIVGNIGHGLMLLVGIKESDNKSVLEFVANKIINLRIFEDEQGKLNKSVVDADGEILIVPNFTIYGDTRKGTRPSYTDAASPEVAEVIFDDFVSVMRDCNMKVQTGKFRAHMEVRLINDGPVTVIVEKD